MNAELTALAQNPVHTALGEGGGGGRLQTVVLSQKTSALLVYLL